MRANNIFVKCRLKQLKELIKNLPNIKNINELSNVVLFYSYELERLEKVAETYYYNQKVKDTQFYLNYVYSLEMQKRSDKLD